IAGDLAEVGGIQGSHRCCEIHRIDHVERLSPELQRLLLTNREDTQHSHIHLEDTGTTDIRRAQVAVRSKWCLQESTRIQPVSGALPAGIYIRQDLIRPLCCLSVQSVIETAGDGEYL